MASYQYSNYYTEYTSKGTDNVEHEKGVCFAKIFNNKHGAKTQDNVYTIYVYKGENMIEKYNKDNNCLFTKEEISHHLSVIKSVLPFSYRISNKKIKYNSRNQEVFLITLHIKGSNIKHRFILTWLRYIYEFPYNFIVRELYRVHKEPGFKRITPFNLFQIMGETINIGGWGGHCITPFSRDSYIISTKDLKERLNTKTCLNDLVQPIMYQRGDKRCVILNDNDRDALWYSKNWDDEQFYQKRLKKYAANYEIKKRQGKKLQKQNKKVKK